MLPALALVLCLLPALAGAANPAAPAASAPAAAASMPPEVLADHVALRKLKADITAAITRRDFEAAGKVLHQPFMATLITQESFTTVPQLKAYYEEVFTRARPRLKDMSMAAEADDLSIIMTGTIALTKGATLEHYVLDDGRAFDMHGRWTATSLRQPDGSWKLLAVHTGVNPLDNPVINAIEHSILWLTAAAGVIGLVLGVALGWLLKASRSRAQAAATGA